VKTIKLSIKSLSKFLNGVFIEMSVTKRKTKI